MANVKVTIEVECYAGDEIYICGNIPQLGSWDCKKALPMKKENGRYSITKMLPQGQVVEFKFLKKQDWAFVEKGMYGEELVNHILFVSKGMETQHYGVDKFGE
ncbi:MAG: hypothetical protein K6E20_01805 [Acholeplasmatales bacterium]|nr:hypothetical protein [Acholeplasmatales bacterium]